MTMKHQLFLLILFFSLKVSATNQSKALAVEFYLDSLIEVNGIDYQIAAAEFLAYAKRNYKKADNIRDFVAYSAFKMKAKEKEYTKNFTKEYHELYKLALMAHKNLPSLEKKIYSVIRTSKADKSDHLLNLLFISIHEFNYWELNCFKPTELAKTIHHWYPYTDNTDLLEKLSLYILAAKIYKASYYVNPMHVCESTCAKIIIKMDMDSLNLNTENITIDSIPTGVRPPIFAGGLEMLNGYITKNIKYPEKALSHGHHGRVLVSFKVNEEGNIYDISIKESPSEFLSKEVIRVVDSFPRWIPDSGTKKGAGFTKFTMPFTFVLPLE